MNRGAVSEAPEAHSELAGAATDCGTGIPARSEPDQTS